MPELLSVPGIIRDFHRDFPSAAALTYFVGTTPDAITTPEALATAFAEYYKSPDQPEGLLYRYHLNGIRKAIGEDEKGLGVALTGEHFIILGLTSRGLTPEAKASLREGGLCGGRLGEIIHARAELLMGEKRDGYELAYAIEHEIGHVLAITRGHDREASAKTYREDKYVSVLDETVADIFALARHIQRFGPDTGFPEYIRDLRARMSVHTKDVVHYTARGISALIALRDKGQLPVMEDAEATLALALGLGAKAVVTGPEGVLLRKAFAGNSSMFDPKDRDAKRAALRIAGFARKAQSPIAREAAQVYLAAVDAALPMDDLGLKQAVAEAHARLTAPRKTGFFQRILKIPAF